MISPDAARAYMATHVIDLFPNLVRGEILSDSSFLKEVGLATDATINFGDKNIAFTRSALFVAIRSAFEKTKEEFDLVDVNGNSWLLSNIADKQHAFCLRKGDVQIVNDSFWPLCPDVDRRIEIFESKAKVGLLSKGEMDSWRAVLLVPTVSDDEVAGLLLDLEQTPSYIEALLIKEFKGPSNRVSTLVPDSARYYERLVGKYSGSKDIDEYCKFELNQYFDNRLGSDVTENDFLICLHRSVSASISNRQLSYDFYQGIANKAIETCHPILLITCFEVGILQFKDRSVTTLKNLFECIASEKTLESLRLFCSMVVFVDGELSRLQIFRGKPPFYRRLASFAQASLIVKLGQQAGGSFGQVEQWAYQERGEYFICQSFVDLLAEPRWLPEYLTKEQFINELFGRVNIACQQADKCELIEYLQGQLMNGSLLCYLPGPLEGNTMPQEMPQEMPDEIANLLARHIDSEVTIESFRVLVNTAPLWKVDNKYLERIVSLLEDAQYKLALLKDKDSVYQVLNGLAQVACMTRNRKIATSLVVLSRLYRDYIDVNSAPEDYLALGFMAGAAFEDKDGWVDYIGQWCTELAYHPINGDANQRIKRMLEALCIQEPYLYYTCGKALDIFKMLSVK